MKKLVFGCTLILSGAFILMGALIGGGAWASSAPYLDINDSETASLFIVVGVIVSITGFVIAVRNLNDEPKDESIE